VRHKDVSIALLTAVIIVIFSVANGEFLSQENLFVMLKTMPELGLIAVGMTMLIIAGEFDLSVGSTFALSPFIMAYLTEKAGLLEGQARFVDRTSKASAEPDRPVQQVSATSGGPKTAPAPAPRPACGCGSVAAASSPSIGPGAASVAEFAPRWTRWRVPALWKELRTAAPRMIAMYFGFAAVGFAAIELVPTAWMSAALGGNSPLSIIFAATLGVPMYLTEGSLPLVSSLMQGGMGPGPAIAFLITGAGTSIGAISGGLIIARWRVIAIVVGTLWVGAVIAGLVAQLVL
jgi:hypothetical protein